MVVCSLNGAMVIRDIAKFVLDNTAPSVNPWDIYELSKLINRAIEDDTLFLQHKDGKLVGVGFGGVIHKRKWFYVFGLTLIEGGSLKDFISSFCARFSGYEMFAFRHGKTRKVNYVKILRKFK